MTDPRKPAAFRVDTEPRPAARPPRDPVAVRADDPALVVSTETDPFDVEAAEIQADLDLQPRRKRSRALSIFLWAAGFLLTLAVGLWTDSLIRELFARADWLGWLAAAVAVLGALGLVVFLAREAIALSRLASVEKLRFRGREVIAQNDTRKAKQLVGELELFLADRPETAKGRRALADLKGEVIDGADLLKLAEIELLVPLDQRARSLALDAAKRVSLVTAVSPRALVDIAYVVFESARLVRRIAELYGARPGALGFLRLMKSVIAHLAVTGAMAAGDEFVHQIVGQGLAARISARLGEGVVNGMMTARIGIAAMEAARPLPFTAAPRPNLGQFLAVLTRLAQREGNTDRN